MIHQLASLPPEERAKKQREYALVEAFLVRAAEFRGWQFSFFDENPDLVYERDGEQLGFESVVIAPDDAAADCFFDANRCELRVPSLDSHERLTLVQAALMQHLLDHLRHYKLPTVIVLTITDDTVNLSELAKNLRLPELKAENIRDYYLTHAHGVYKVRETQPL